MARDFKSESDWAKAKYLRMEIKIDKERYGEVVDKIKNEYGTSNFIRRSVELFQKHPELYK